MVLRRCQLNTIVIKPSMSIQDHAFATIESHLKKWMPRTSRSHRYLTRYQVNRSDRALTERDVSFFKEHMGRLLPEQSKFERIQIIGMIFTYLTREQHLLLFEPFRSIVWDKMGELEASANKIIMEINRLTTYNEFNAEKHVIESANELLQIMCRVRNLMRK